ncbi:MAG: DUF975 family protein [Bacteroidales bacterium]|nr:DUF975 family protein [Bacteroidales bacterium]
MPRNSEIRRAARYALRGNWTQAVLATLVYTLICSAAGSIPLVGLLVVCPLEFGFMLCFLRLVRGEDSSEMVGDQFDVFNKYGRYLGGSLLVTLYTLLWMLLFIIPGIVKGYAYAMTPYVMNDRPDLDADDCIHESRMMMKGYKWKLFCLDLSFIGWAILCIFTLGIGLLWLQPYIEASHAKFYEELKARRA